MTQTQVPDTLHAKYHGCGAYLVAFGADGQIVDLSRVHECLLPTVPARPRKRGALSRVEKASHIRATSAAYRARDAARAEWAQQLRAWAPLGATKIEVYDLSCFALCPRYSDLSWEAHDAVAGTPHPGLHEIEERASAYAAEARLGAPK